MVKKDSLVFPEVNFSEEGLVRHLHLGSEWIQGSMLIEAPNLLVHEYIQRMMAWLLFVDPASVVERRAMQLGLGAGSLTKFCYKELRMQHTVAIEINPQVLQAYYTRVKTGIRGMGFVRTRADVAWPDSLQVKMPTPPPKAIDGLSPAVAAPQAAAPAAQTPDSPSPVAK